MCLKRSRYQLEPIELKGLPGAEDTKEFDDEEDADTETVNEEPNAGATGKRFLSVSSEESTGQATGQENKQYGQSAS